MNLKRLFLIVTTCAILCVPIGNLCQISDFPLWFGKGLTQPVTWYWGAPNTGSSVDEAGFVLGFMVGLVGFGMLLAFGFTYLWDLANDDYKK
jgi:hypothetical protein